MLVLSFGKIVGDPPAPVPDCHHPMQTRSAVKGLYRGLLKSIARVWKPDEIHDVDVLGKVLEHMQAAQRGLRRLAEALADTGPEGIDPILRSLKLRSLDRVDNLDTLKRVVLAVEEAAAKARR